MTHSVGHRSSDDTHYDARLAVPKLVAGLLAFVALILLATGIGAKRTIVVSAQTRSIIIEFASQSDYWSLGTTTLCEPIEKVDRTANRGSGPCDNRRYIASSRPVDITWQAGAKVEVTSARDTGWWLEVSGLPHLHDGTRIFITPELSDRIGPLSFSGTVRVGQIASSGETDLLYAGDYEIREKPFFSRSTETIKQGSFRLGESFTIQENADGTESPARVFGYILLDDQMAQGFEVRIVSETGKKTLSIDYFGSDSAISIAPNWIDRSLASPLILALSILLPVVWALLQLMGNHNNKPTNSASLGMIRRIRLMRRRR